jgi:large subunit ribosomal protein L30
MARKPPTRKYRKRKPPTHPVLPPVETGGGKGGRLEIRQVRSGIGRPATERRTLEAIGLKHHQDVVVKRDHPALRGMIIQVRHLVQVTPAKEKEGE